MSDLLTTKLYIPHRRSDAVPRPQLIESLKAGMGRKLTLITAPAGFGKTTLLCEWIPQSERCVTWVSLDEGDNDPVRFWSYFIAALRKLDAEIGRNALTLLQSIQPPPAEAFLTTLLNEIAAFQDSFAHVLDDFQVIRTQTIHTAIQFILEHAPPNMHLVICSRTDPPLPLGRLRARDQLNEIRAADLRFTSDEAAVFLNRSMGLNLSTENVISLETQTEGWIAGLQMAGLAIQGHGLQVDDRILSEFIEGFNGSHRYIVSYLVEEVLSQRPEGTMDFLLQTSILDRLSGPLCDYVLRETRIEHSDNGRSENNTPHSILDSQSILEQLESSNLFIVPLDTERKWYRYHHLFSQVLRVHLRKSHPEKLRRLHLRASEWHEQSGLIPEAVKHAIEAKEWERTARLIEQNAIGYGSKGQINLLLGWLTALPETIFRSHPLLCVFHAGTLLRNNHLEDVEVRLQDAEGGIHEDTPADQARIILGRVYMLRSNLLRIQGDIQSSVDLSQQALDSLPETEIVPRATARLNRVYRFLITGDVQDDNEYQVTSALESAHATGNVFTILRGKTLLAKLYALQGHLHQSFENYKETSLGKNPMTQITGIPDYSFGIGDLEREWNHLDEAENILAKETDQARWQITDSDVLSHGYQALARLKQARGDTQGAKATMKEFIRLAHQQHFADRLIASARAVEAWLDLMMDDVPAAALWAETRGIQIDDELSFPLERENLTLARLFIRSGQDHPENDWVQKALRLLDRLRAAAQANGRLGSLIEILSLQAIAYQVMGDQDQALKAIEQAITLASPESYIRTFVDEGEPMKFLIADFRLLIEKQPDRSISLFSYVDHLLVAFQRPTSISQFIKNQQSAISNLPNPLSDRELGVLQLIAEGASNQEISIQLVIAPPTVKRHISNIFNKLDVVSRTQAVAAGRKIGLL